MNIFLKKVSAFDIEHKCNKIDGNGLQMKVYGKRSGSSRIYADQDDEFEVELSDEESEPEHLSESNVHETIPGNSTDDGLPMTSDLKENSSFASSVDSNFAHLKAFDFLDNAQKPQKRRRINQEGRFEDRQDEEDSGENRNPLNSTIDDLDKFLSSLKSGDEMLLQDTFKKELQKSVENSTVKDNTGKLTYGRSRTMLISKDDEEGLEAEDEDPKSTKLDDEKKDGSQTFHINELKNMGDMLQYQADLELLLEGSPSRMSRFQFVSHLLNIALAMNGDPEFCRYIKKKQTIEMWNRIFSQFDLNDAVLLLIQGFLAIKFQLPSEELPEFFDEFVLALYKFTKLPENGISGNKIAQLNYADFLHNTQNRTGKEYALKLCVQYPAVLLSYSPLVNQIVHDLEGNASLPLGFFSAIEQLVSSEKILQDDSLVSMIANKLVDLLPIYCENDHLIKSLILVTNEKIAERESEIFQLSMKFVLDHLPPLGSVDVLILHLGLCLNVISGDTAKLHVENTLWLQAQNQFQKLKSNNDYSFLLNLFYLNFAYMTVLLDKRLSTKAKTDLTSQLELFAQDSQHYNESIPEKIRYIRNKL